MTKFYGRVTEVAAAVEDLSPVELRAVQIELMCALTAVCYQIERNRRHGYNGGETEQPSNNRENPAKPFGLPEGNHSS